MMLNGSSVTCVVIENDGEYTGIKGLGEDRDYTKLPMMRYRKLSKKLAL